MVRFFPNLQPNMIIFSRKKPMGQLVKRTILENHHMQDGAP